MVTVHYVNYFLKLAISLMRALSDSRQLETKNLGFYQNHQKPKPMFLV